MTTFGWSLTNPSYAWPTSERGGKMLPSLQIESTVSKNYCQLQSNLVTMIYKVVINNHTTLR